MKGLELATIVLLALSSNLDNVGVGVAYGARRIAVPWASNLLIALITGAGTLAAMLLGERLYALLPRPLAACAGAILITGAGLWISLAEARKLTSGRGRTSNEAASPGDLADKSALGKALLILDDPAVADLDSSGHISLREASLLAAALALNNIANGLGAGMLRLDPWLTTLLVTLLSLATIRLGTGLGQDYGRRWLGELSGLAAGLLLVAVGVMELLV